MPNDDLRIVNLPEEQSATLKVLCERLDLDSLEDFEEACRELLHTGQQTLTLDLCKLSRIHSGFIGVLLYANSEAHLAGRRLVVAAGGRVARTLEKVAPGLIEISEGA